MARDNVLILYEDPVIESLISELLSPQFNIVRSNGTPHKVISEYSFKIIIVEFRSGVYDEMLMEIIKEWRFYNPHTRFIAVTSPTLVDFGFDAIITKPVNFQVLSNIIKGFTQLSA